MLSRQEKDIYYPVSPHWGEGRRGPGTPYSSPSTEPWNESDVERQSQEWAQLSHPDWGVGLLHTDPALSGLQIYPEKSNRC